MVKMRIVEEFKRYGMGDAALLDRLLPSED
jgi:hypothetical protein